ncbi:ABC transporter substrate-binding protein [Bradyrhizobium manausense]|uniref:ABC transporter substrate-binding protein n=1 Tax=Bradyrhizobium TaxID=374 RepID=UPI001BAC78AB|nr:MULTISPECIES: ABC transporter substrate-binding protein [Bradyrhizobium]MBR0825814.1 ABC transporter substrate-binding protein [Bradyrhizobium manausense]UVO31245.1 ABC transporter substrate-binding protein [Bradyrhizobium arachidis]
MKRRDVLAGICAASVWPGVGLAQQSTRRLAFVHSGIPADRLTESRGPFWVRRFYEALRGLGDVEGTNLIVERFSAEGRSDRFGPLVAEVVARKPQVIVTNLNDLVKGFMAATTSIPIVAVVGDPLAGGLVTNLARPGANLTGVSINAGVEIYAKRLQIIKEALPSATRIGHLLSGNWAPSSGVTLADASARLGVSITRIAMPVVDETELARTFADISEQKLDGVIPDEGGSFLAARATLTALAAKHRIPVIYPFRDYVEEGGLMALAPDLGELAVRMADDVHQIFNGAKAGDIPFYQPSKFLLIFNLKTAKAMGLDLPVNLIARADEVIE